MMTFQAAPEILKRSPGDQVGEGSEAFTLLTPD
jgi:hypothetical protein